MSGISDVADELCRVLSILDSAVRLVQRAVSDVGEAAQTWQQATDGSSSNDVDEGGPLWWLAAERLAEAAALLVDVRAAIQGYLDNLTGVGSVPAAAVAPSPPDRGPRPGHERYPGVIESVRRDVGTGVHGAQTRGAWLKRDGTTENVRSGRDTEWYERTKQALMEGVGRELALSLSTHVEMQFVTRMVIERRTDETLILDRPARGVEPPVLLYQCHRRLPMVIRKLLPPGATLTVVSTDGTKWRYSERGRERL